MWRVAVNDGESILDALDSGSLQAAAAGESDMFEDMRAAVLAVGVLLMQSQSVMTQDPISLVRSISLPGVEGRIDHFAWDASTGRLFMAALGNNTVEVLDLKAGTHSRSLSGFREPQGIAAIPDAKLVAVANGQGEGLQLVNADDLRMGAVIRLGDDADNVRYDASARHIYVGYGSGAIASVDPSNAKALGEAKLPGHPESFQLERSGPRIFVNVPSAGIVAVIDRTAMKVVATWPVTGARSNYPMALDESDHRLFIGCRSPAKVLVYDTVAGKRIGEFEIVGDTDDLFYDAARKRLYVSGGEGFIDVFQIGAASQATRIAHVATAAGARTSLFITDLSQLALAVPHRSSQQAEVRIYQVK
jgi:DNA-binding beta-propeller fold protein YncE